ncbi:ATP-binding response regulator [Ottowia thiooxydans]
MPLPPAVAERVLASKVEAQARTDRDARWLETTVNALVAIFFYWQTGSWLVFLWVGLRAPTHLIGLWISNGYRADPEREQHSDRWARRFTTSTALDSTLWGLACWLLPPAGSPLLHGLLVILIGVASSAAVYGTQLWPIVLGWVLPMNIGLLTALLWQGQPLFLFMFACAAINLGIVLYFGRQQQQLMTQTLMTRFEKEDLANQLVQQVKIAHQASEDKTRFLAAASHDLRQPMHAITLFGAVLEKELAGHPQHANAQRLMRAADALSASLGTMLDTSRLDAGAIEPTVAPVALNTILRSLSQTFVADAEQRGLQLRMRATPLWVHTDADLLQRMLSNLIENALKYTPEGGVLVVARARNQEVWIDVVDTGIGIAAEHQEPIFAEFYQVDNAGRDRSRGLGMGLSIVRRLSNLLGHPVHLKSRPERGSRFRVVLPAAPAQPHALPPPPVSAALNATFSTASGARVLLLEDEADIAQAMHVLLSSYGVDLVHATTTEQAQRLLEQGQVDRNSFHAMICDLRLADGVDGLDFALSLSQRGLIPPPTLLITGETAPAPLQRVRQAGMPVLFKPVTASDLLEALSPLLEARRT